MADPEKTPGAETVSVVEHSNIYEALAAFQGENPQIVKNKRFGKESDAKTFMYASLDSFLDVVRPLTAKHGIAITWEGVEDGLVCALYHATYKRTEAAVETRNETSEKTERAPLGEVMMTQTVKTTEVREEGVIRSMPVKVKRDGDMQTIGNNSTYARRYTLSEVLGVASDEDTDAEIEKQSGQNAQGAMYARAKKGIEDAKTSADVEKAVKVLKADMKLIEGGKAPSLGLKKEAYAELIELGNKKIGDLDTNQGHSDSELGAV